MANHWLMTELKNVTWCNTFTYFVFTASCSHCFQLANNVIETELWLTDWHGKVKSKTTATQMSKLTFPGVFRYLYYLRLPNNNTWSWHWKTTLWRRGLCIRANSDVPCCHLRRWSGRGKSTSLIVSHTIYTVCRTDLMVEACRTHARDHKYIYSDNH
jgi:hypothetical protein